MKYKSTILLIMILSAAIASAAAPRPNIVYFFADDMGWAGIKANQQLAAAQGVDITEISKVITPHLDSLVAGGINFSHAYGNNVCSPSRSSQQTGFHQGHTWADRNDPSDDKSMRTQDPTLGKLLDAAGYRNGMYGKWGYGASKDLNNPVIVNEQTLPINHGYHDCLVELHHVRAHTYLQPSFWYSHVDTNGVVTLPTTLKLNTETYPALEVYADNYYTAGAIDFIRAEANGPSPFFAQISFQVPHSPYGDIVNLPGWFDDYAGTDTSTWGDTTKQYAAMITHMDKHIGEVLDTLRDPNNDGDESDSVMANTLIIFASDNGGANATPVKFFHENGHLLGYKTSVNEGGIRDPLAFYWEGVIAPGQSTNYLTSISDMLPTLCELAGIDHPVGIDGTSIAPLLTGEGTLRKRPYFCYEGSGWSVVKDNYKLKKDSGGALHLYDLDADEAQTTDLSGEAYTAIRDELNAIGQGDSLDEGDLFANCFPTWVGSDAADINSSNSWQDTGERLLGEQWPYGDTPQPFWNAVVHNTTPTNRTAVLNDSIQTLGFEVAGSTNGAALDVQLAPGVSIGGRNEIRISEDAALGLNGGTLSSMRFVDLRKGAVLEGLGKIDANLYQAGRMDITPEMTITTTNIIPGSSGAEIELISNGGFESGTQADADSDYRYTELDNWTSDGADPANKDGGKYDTSNSQAGTYRGMISGGYNLLQNSGHAITANESYTLDFWHAGFSLWDATDEMDVTIFYEDGGTRHTLYSMSLTPTPGKVWNNKVVSIPDFTDANAVGKNLWISFGPGTGVGSSEFASVDSVSLKTAGATTPASTNITVESFRDMAVSGDFVGYASARIGIELGGTATNDYSQLIIDGDATLNGRLDVKLAEGYTPTIGDTFDVISAGSIVGRFKHPGHRVSTTNGVQFLIHYTASSVQLEAIEAAPIMAPITRFTLQPGSNQLHIGWSSSEEVLYRLVSCTNLMSAGTNSAEWVTVTNGLCGAEAETLKTVYEGEINSDNARFYSIQEQ